MNFAERKAEADRLLNEAKSILGNKDASAEDRARVPELMKAADSIRESLIQMKQIGEMTSQLTSFVDNAQKTDPVQQPSDFKSWNNFLTAISVWAKTAQRHPKLEMFNDKEEKGLSEATGAGGGFLVPSEFQAQLMSVMAERTVVRSRATVIRMRRRQIDIPVLDQTGTTSGIGHWFGGIQAYWTEEGAQKTETTPAFRQISLTARKLALYTRATDELLDDSAISLTDFLTGPLGFAGAIAWHEDYAFLRGTGVGQPLGILNSPALVTVTRGTPIISYEDLVGMVEAFMPGGNGVWVISQSLMADLLALNGPSGNPSYIWSSPSAGVPSTLLGMPVVWTEKLPGADTKGDIMLADFSYYLVGDRQATTIESTQFDRWRYDETSWRAVHRVDGQPWLSAPLTLADGSTQVSPFVVLSTGA